MAGRCAVWVFGLALSAQVGFAQGAPVSQGGPAAQAASAAQATSVAETASQTVPPVDAFFTYNEIPPPALSPSGRFFAFVDTDAEPSVVRVVSTDGLTPVHTVSLIREDLPGVADTLGVEWATDDRLLVTAQVAVNYRFGNTARIDNVATQQIIAINRDGSGPVPLVTNSKYRRALDRSDIASLLPDDPQHILVQVPDRRMHLVRVNVLTGKAKTVERGNSRTVSWDVNRAGVPVVRYDLVGDGEWMRILVRAPGERGWRLLTRVRSSGVLSVAPIAPTSEPGIWFIAGRKPGDERSAIWRYDLTKGPDTEDGGQGWLERVFADPQADVRSPVVDADGKLMGARFANLRSTYRFRSPNANAHFAAVQAFVGEDQDLEFLDVSADRRWWLMRSTGPKQPGVTLLYDRQERRADYLHARSADLSPGQLGRVEVVDYTARDGLRIGGYLTHPVGVAKGLIVMPHGGPHVRDHYGFEPNAQFFAGRGYAVFQPNFRGSTGFGKSFEEAGFGEWGRAMQDDLADGVAHLLDSGRARGPVGVFGWSYGGYAAMVGAVRADEPYRCGVAVNGVSDLALMMTNDRERMGSDSEVFALMERSVGPEAGWVSPAELAGELAGKAAVRPMLIAAGLDDVRVDPEQSRRMAAALTAA